MLDKETLGEILNALAQEARGAWWNSEWTRRIKFALKEHASGQDSSIKVYGSGLEDPDCWGEWLWDMVWAKWANVDGRPDYLKSLLLVLESEWGKYEDVIEDFEKLLVARAEIRVMIFDDIGTEGKKERLFEEELKERVTQYEGSQPGDKYLFAIYRTKTPGDSRFDVSSYTYGQ